MSFKGFPQKTLSSTLGKFIFGVSLILVMVSYAVTPACGQGPSVSAVTQSLINRHASLLNGWAWESVIQSPNYQMDRDVGTASVLVGLLAAYDVTGNASYLSAAEGAGTFLVNAQTPAGSGRWPDYYNPTGPANYGFTSLDDGAAGISDALWMLYERDGKVTYGNTALAGMNWVVSKAQAPSGYSCPSQQCFWYWEDPEDGEIYNGVGSGLAGIVYTLDQFAQRTTGATSTTYENYALAGAAYLEAQISSEGAIPDVPGDTTSYSTGLYGGAAGESYVFYSLYRHTGNTRWLNDANTVMAWVRAQQVTQYWGAAWPISVGSGGDSTFSTEIAEGAAGIGWAELQAYKVTGAPIDLSTAVEAGDWLYYIAVGQSGGFTWPAYYGQNTYYTALDLGVAGISVFLYDLSVATNDSDYLTVAQGAQTWLNAVSYSDSDGVYWYIDKSGKKWQQAKEPSWNWGLAGIDGAAARLGGWKVDMPRDVPGFGTSE